MSAAVAPVLIVGQGLAGSLLARALERRGVAFTIVDAGHQRAASRVGAGIINPVTGMRMVKSAGIDEYLPHALRAYRDLEAVWGIELIRAVQVRRTYVDEVERGELRARLVAGKLAPYVSGENPSGNGFVIEPAWRVDLPALIASGRSYWTGAGCLEERVITPDEAAKWPGSVVWCDGAGAVHAGLTPTLGSLVEIHCPDLLETSAILNRGGQWLLPLDAHRAWVGATYVRNEREDLRVSEAALMRTADELLEGRAFKAVTLLSGVRMTTADRRPLMEFLDGRGAINGLGSKGALYAPAAAEAIASAIVKYSL